jgi:hypothetical protein
VIFWRCQYKAQTNMSACAFIGPTRVNQARFADFDFFPPVQLGFVFRALYAGYRIICIVDGVFGNIPSVWHKEILFALHSGAAVFGAASTGALRAAELNPYGMIGIGSIFRLYNQKAILDDDEVCLSHAPEERRTSTRTLRLPFPR